MSSASEAAPTTSAPRNGALRETVASGAGGAATATPFSTSVGGAVTATDRLPLPFSLPGRYSSKTAWKLVPPKPNALTAARRGVSPGTVHGFSSVLTYSGEWAKSMSGLGFSQCKLGGSNLWCSANVVLRIPAAPAAPFRCPKFDFTEPRAIEPLGRLELLSTSTRLCASTTSPTRVDVPWPSNNVAVAGDNPAFCQPRSMHNFWPMGLGAVMPFPLPSLEPPMPRSTA